MAIAGNKEESGNDEGLHDGEVVAAELRGREEGHEVERGVGMVIMKKMKAGAHRCRRNRATKGWRNRVTKGWQNRATKGRRNRVTKGRRLEMDEKELILVHSGPILESRGENSNRSVEHDVM